MLTFEKVFEIFGAYLEEDLEIEVLQSRRGYIRLQWAGQAPYCDDTSLYLTPESLFDALLEDFKIHEGIKRTRGRRELTEEDEKVVLSLCQPYLEKRRKEKNV
ncbi:hypothetical protein MUB23_17310 [Cuneatibacter sp. NSJ-177]|uniref:hypothetical protein n=1 Tax=Cuneatibacter sp. NSJ-177 TaxID=2931401 RepID=UPI001FD234E6|nr:hypothetical protein [Cuneatibacter sp. NSJ-177]MCJ7837136.1 hypothetical protein [Cuneatibacter sp. NSJ-177]